MKPLCEVCGDRHEPHQAHVFKKAFPFQGWQESPVANTAAVANGQANAVANKKSKYRDPEARRKYMRELMRKRRAVAR